MRFYRLHRFPEQTNLIVERPDGSIVHLPEWMTLPGAAEIELEDQPRLSLQALCDLRGSAAVLPTGLDGFVSRLAAAPPPALGRAFLPKLIGARVGR